jgi:hypothetical protein
MTAAALPSRLSGGSEMATKRKRAGKTAISKERARADNARRREQAKRMEMANTAQQGSRANVRQNTTAQGYARAK